MAIRKEQAHSSMQDHPDLRVICAALLYGFGQAMGWGLPLERVGGRGGRLAYGFSCTLTEMSEAEAERIPSDVSRTTR